MGYTLWSRGRLIGSTDLDVHTVSERMRQGFIEPTEAGTQLLDATGVFRAVAEDRVRRADGIPRDGSDLAKFEAACDRREALNLELRDEHGAVLECAYMRVHDLRELDRDREVDSVCDAEDEKELPEYLASLSPEERAEFEAQRAADDGMIEEWLAELEEDRADEEMYRSTRPPPPPDDERWETMQYFLQVFLTDTISSEEF